MLTKILGRFEVEKELVREPYGGVYLGTDTRMSRQVSVKKIGPVSIAQGDEILRDARAASVLHHHAIIPVYDLGAADGTVYLVYMHIPGETVEQVLQRSEIMSVGNAVSIVTDVLDALSNAHSLGVLHLDINSSNILISTEGKNYVKNFGIARSISRLRKPTDQSQDSSACRAPEVASELSGGKAGSDIYSAGMLLYEMLNGLQVVGGKDIRNTSGSGMKIDANLLNIIFKATEKNPLNRYTSAMDMRQALMDYLETLKMEPAEKNDADVSSTLKFLLRRIKSKSDFPAISGVINEINKVVSSETEDSGKLAQLILQDFSLTNKLLKLVNTASYSQFGGKISTVSKAVSILGFETVRNIATTLVVLDFLQNKAQSQELKDTVVSSFFSGIVAVKLSDWKSMQEVEEAMISSMFFNLGKILAKFYFYDESEEVAQLVASKHISEEQAALEVLGISFNELGLGIARTWNFPEKLIGGMQKINSDKVIDTEDNFGRLNVAVNMSNDLCAIANVNDATAKEAALNKIKTRYSIVADTSDEKLVGVLKSGLQDMSQRSRALGLDITKSTALEGMKQLLVHTVDSANKRKNVKSGTTLTGEVTENGKSVVDILLAGSEVGNTEDAEAFLKDGLQDVINTMSAEYKLNDILQMVLETIYRGIGFKHVLIMSRDNKINKMIARFGFGENIVDILPHFNFPLIFEADVFHLTLQKGLDIVIEDVAAANIASKIPAWHGKAVDSRYFLLLPMLLNKNAIGMIYADMQEPRKLKITPAQMSLLRNLRDQAVLAIKQKSQG